MGVSVTLDEADKKMQSGRWDPLAVKNKDPNYHYRWLRQDKLNMARKTGYLGYEVVSSSGEQGERSVLMDNTPMKKAADTTSQVEVGDLVLAKIPKELHEKYRALNRGRIKDRTTGVVQSYKNAVNSAAGDRLAYEENREAADMADKEGER